MSYEKPMFLEENIPEEMNVDLVAPGVMAVVVIVVIVAQVVANVGDPVK